MKTKNRMIRSTVSATMEQAQRRKKICFWFHRISPKQLNMKNNYFFDFQQHIFPKRCDLAHESHMRNVCNLSFSRWKIFASNAHNLFNQLRWVKIKYGDRLYREKKIKTLIYAWFLRIHNNDSLVCVLYVMCMNKEHNCHVVSKVPSRYGTNIYFLCSHTNAQTIHSSSADIHTNERIYQLAACTTRIRGDDRVHFKAACV